MASSENVAATYSWTLDAGEIIKRAAQMAGVLDLDGTPTPAMYSFGRDALNTELKALQTRGMILHTIERTDRTLTSGTASYALAADTIDVDSPSAIVDTDGVTVMQLAMIPRDEKVLLSPTDSTGQPTHVYVEKTRALLTAYFWPIPDAAYVWRYQRVRLLLNVDSTAQTTDLQSKWMKALVYAVATWFAEHYGQGEVKMRRLSSLAEKNLNSAANSDTERGDVQFYLE